jgi:hypothetical protein
MESLIAVALWSLLCQDPSQLSTFVRENYSVLHPDTLFHPDYRVPQNRFRSLGDVDSTAVFPEHCWAFALLDGLYCYRAVHGVLTVVPLAAQMPVPAVAKELARHAIGEQYDAIANDIMFTSYVKGAAARCATFFTRRVDVEAKDLTPDLAYGTEEFGSGFACQGSDNRVALTWHLVRTRHYGERFSIFGMFFHSIAMSTCWFSHLNTMMSVLPSKRIVLELRERRRLRE